MLIIIIRIKYWIIIISIVKQMAEQLQFRSLVIVEVFEVDAMADAIGNNAVLFFFLYGLGLPIGRSPSSSPARRGRR